VKTIEFLQTDSVYLFICSFSGLSFATYLQWLTTITETLRTLWNRVIILSLLTRHRRVYPIVQLCAYLSDKDLNNCWVYLLEIVGVLVLSVFYFITALHRMQTRSSDDNSVRPSICLSVRRINCDKTEEKSLHSRFLYYTKER